MWRWLANVPLACFDSGGKLGDEERVAAGDVMEKGGAGVIRLGPSQCKLLSDLGHSQPTQIDPLDSGRAGQRGERRRQSAAWLGAAMVDNQEHGTVRDSRGEVTKEEQRRFISPVGVVNDDYDATALACRPRQRVGEAIEEFEPFLRSLDVGTDEVFVREFQRAEHLAPRPKRWRTGTFGAATPSHSQPGGKRNAGELLR